MARKMHDGGEICCCEFHEHNCTQLALITIVTVEKPLPSRCTTDGWQHTVIRAWSNGGTHREKGFVLNKSVSLRASVESEFHFKLSQNPRVTTGLG